MCLLMDYAHPGLHQPNQTNGTETMYPPFNIKSTLSASNSVDLDDSLNAKKAFNKLGYYPTPSYGITQYPDQPLFDGIKKFQSDHGLQKDGVMKPGGETAQTLGKVLEQKKQSAATPKPATPTTAFSTPKPKLATPAFGQPKTPAPAKPSGLQNRSDTGAFGGGQFAAPKKQKAKPLGLQPRQPSLEEAIAKPVVALLQKALKRKPLSAEAFSSNGRTVAAAKKTADHRDLAKVHALAIQDFGDDALHEVADFNDQLMGEDEKAHKSWWKAFTELDRTSAEKLRNFQTAEDQPKEKPKGQNAKPERKSQSRYFNEDENIYPQQSKGRKNSNDGSNFGRTLDNELFGDDTVFSEKSEGVQVADHKEFTPKWFKKQYERYEQWRKEPEEETAPNTKTIEMGINPDLLKNTKWKEHAEPNQRGENRTYKTNGPVRIDHTSTTPGLDGTTYHVKWWPLDEDGKRKPILENPKSLGKQITSVSGFNKKEPRVFAPPYDNPGGWEFHINTSAYISNHGNSSGHLLNVFTADETRKGK